MAIKLRLIKLRFGKHVPVTPEDVIPQENLGTGSTGAGTKVLYDDGTWKTPTGGSGSTSSNVLIDCGTIASPNENVLIDCGNII